MARLAQDFDLVQRCNVHALEERWHRAARHTQAGEAQAMPGAGEMGAVRRRKGTTAAEDNHEGGMQARVQVGSGGEKGL